MKASSPTAGVRHARPRPVTLAFGAKKGNRGYRGEQGRVCWHPWTGNGEMAPTTQLKQCRVCSPALRLSVTAWLASTHLKFFPSLSFHPQNQYECGQVLVGTVHSLCHPQNGVWVMSGRQGAGTGQNYARKHVDGEQHRQLGALTLRYLLAQILPSCSWTKYVDLQYKANAWWCLDCSEQPEEPPEQSKCCTGSLVQVGLLVFLFDRSCFCFMCVLALAKVKKCICACRRRSAAWGTLAAGFLPSLLVPLVFGCLHCLTSWAGESSMRLGCSHCSCLHPDWIVSMLSCQGNSSLPSLLPLTGLFRGIIFPQGSAPI